MKVISEKRLSSDGRVGGYTNFELRSDVEPTIEEVSESQVRCGYHPAGYSGPWNIVTKKVGNEYVTTWSCAGSCD